MINGRSATYRDPRLQRRCTECGLNIELCTCEAADDAAHRRLWAREGRALCEVWRALQKAVDDGVQDVTREGLAGNSVLLTASMLKKMRDHNLGKGTTAEEIHTACLAIATNALLLTLYGDPDYAYEPGAIHDRED